ncbi:MAG TPA: hypothetical protein VGR21_03875, partial [Cryptosporangiaceae bacterium]|nr:hypothetical protein [Cryptosporangiaceae bacterium]
PKAAASGKPKDPARPPITSALSPPKTPPGPPADSADAKSTDAGAKPADGKPVEKPAGATSTPPEAPTPEAPTPSSPTWDSPADIGWRAAMAAAEPAVAATTETGLPKRVPMAHYVPGRVDSQIAKRPTRPQQRRSPEAVRGVLSSYRSGLEQGRQAGHTPHGAVLTESPDEQEEM